MAATVIGGTELILDDWNVLAVCSGLNMETGGTMNVTVYFDPALDPVQLADPVSAEGYAKYISDPEMIASMMRGAKPRVRRSPQMSQILALDFGSYARDTYFDWVLHQKLDNLLSGSVKAMVSIGRRPSEATAFLAELLPNLGQLDDWAEVNRARFSFCRLLVETEIAVRLALEWESVPEHSDYVPIHRRRLI